MYVGTHIPAFLRAAVPNTRPPALARRPGPKAAHTEVNAVTDAVFHAPMFALNADAEANACEPSHPRSTPTGKAPARCGADACAPDRTRTRARARTYTWRVRTPMPTSQQYTHTHMYKIYIYVHNVIM